MAMALAYGLPARLDAAADALELANRKDAAGERLMHQMAKPRRPHKDEDPAGTYWFDDPERLDRLYNYCQQDVEVERELYGRLPRAVVRRSRQLWGLSSRINERGFCVDRNLPRLHVGLPRPRRRRSSRARRDHRRRRHRYQPGRAAAAMAAAAGLRG